MVEYYRPILTLHVIAIISWMAGILYLYRLLVYATEKGYGNAEIYALLGVMSRRLYRYITVPAMVVAWVAGLAMVGVNHVLAGEPWFIVKFASVVLLTASTVYAGRLVKKYHARGALPSSKTIRLLNELPTVLMVVIVIMVIMRPF